MNIVVSNVKGGVGKSTTAVYLSALAVLKGYDPVLLIDADRQASSAEWIEERPVEGVTLIEAPSERTVTRAMTRHDGLAVVDTPPRVAATLDMINNKTPHGVVICAARLGTNDLEEAIAWWNEQKVPIWGVIPERVGIAAGPEARLNRDGLAEYDIVFRRVLRSKGRS